MAAPSGRLRERPYRPESVLVTGASGYVGALIAARLLADGECALLLPVRAPSRETLIERLKLELDALGLPWGQAAPRVRIVEWPGAGESGDGLAHWAGELGDSGVDTIVHCAGCLDYFDSASLELVNVRLTGDLIALGRRVGARRFVYVSTAYSGGYRHDEIPETLLPEPERDPTEYTRTKRRAEWLVAESGLPWVVLRPSILIGECRSGRYSGKRYGLYQQWMGLERLMTDRYHPVIHTVAPERPLNLVHQDSFQAAFSAALAWLPDASVCNLVSENDSAPSMRDLWNLWIEVVRPEEIRYYPSFASVNLRAIDIRQRAYLTFAQVNLEIGAHRWRFARGWIEALAARGLAFEGATAASVLRCQERFVASSQALARYRERFAERFPAHTRIVEVEDHARTATAL